MKTSKELGILPYHRRNLIKMALWLYDNRHSIHFTMDSFAELPRTCGGIKHAGTFIDMEMPCGTSCCIIGHSVNKSIGLDPGESSHAEILGKSVGWTHLAYGWFGINFFSPEGRFLFAGPHRNNVMAAVKRIFWFLEKGLVFPSSVISYAHERWEVHDTWTQKLIRKLHLYRENLGYTLDPGNKWTLDIEKWRAER